MTHYSIKRLADMLLDHCVPFELTEDAEGNEKNQIWYPSEDKPICDVICHKYSYGGEEGYLEIMGLTENEDDVEGWLTAEQVFHRIYNDYFEVEQFYLFSFQSISLFIEEGFTFPK